MNNRKLCASKAAYLRRRKQKLLKKLKQIHCSNRTDVKVSNTCRLLARADSEMNQIMNGLSSL